MLRERDVIPTGFIRLMDGTDPVCDMPIEQLDLLVRTERLTWVDDHYELTDAGRAYVRGRLLN